MTDTLTTVARSERMSRVRGKNTIPELIVRRLVHKLGYRYKLHQKNLPGCPDLVFTRKQKVIFVHGCFWHRHASKKCKLARLPKSRLDFWLPKFEGNILRDRKNQKAIKSIGWKSLIIWECEMKDQASLEKKIISFLES